MSSDQTIWEQYDFTGKVLEVLSSFQSPQRDPDDGPTFLTAYQLAIELRQCYVAGIDLPDWPIGGEGLGMYNSLAQYLARHLPPKVKKGEIAGIQVAFISHKYMTNLTFNNRGEQVRASTLSSEEKQTLFGFVSPA